MRDNQSSIIFAAANASSANSPTSPPSLNQTPKQSPAQPKPTASDNYSGDIQKSQSPKTVASNTTTSAPNPTINNPISSLTFSDDPIQETADATDGDLLSSMSNDIARQTKEASIVNNQLKTDVQIDELKKKIEHLLQEEDGLAAAAKELVKLQELSKSSNNEAITTIVNRLSTNISKAILSKYMPHFSKEKLEATLNKLIREGHIKPEDIESIANSKDDNAIRDLTARVLQKRLSDTSDPALQKDIQEIIDTLKANGQDLSTGNVLGAMSKSKSALTDLVGERNLLALYRTDVFADIKTFEEERRKVDKLREDEVKKELKDRDISDIRSAQKAQDRTRTEEQDRQKKLSQHIKSTLAAKYGAQNASKIVLYAANGNMNFSVLTELGTTQIVNLIELGLLAIDPHVERYLLKHASIDEQKRVLSQSAFNAAHKEQAQP